MKKILIFTAALLLVAAFGLGGVSLYIYLSSRQECSDMVERSAGMERTASAARGSADEAERKKDADYARSGAVMVCENARDRRQNAMLIGIAGIVTFVIACTALILSRRMKPQKLSN